MAKYWGKQICTHGRFPEVGQKQKTEGKRKRRERKKERLNDGDNNGQATHGARKPPGPKCRVAFSVIQKQRRASETRAEIAISQPHILVIQWPNYAWRTEAFMAHASRLGQNNLGLSELN